jgi:hypothetical protein
MLTAIGREPARHPRARGAGAVRRQRSRFCRPDAKSLVSAQFADEHEVTNERLRTARTPSKLSAYSADSGIVE